MSCMLPDAVLLPYKEHNISGYDIRFNYCVVRHGNYRLTSMGKTSGAVVLDLVRGMSCALYVEREFIGPMK